jgi:hypothetical protein
MKFKQVLTIIGICILLASVGLGAYFAYTKGLLFSNPDPTIQPKKIKVSNINHDRWSVSWITDEPTNGSLIFGTSAKLDQLQIDDSDQLSGQQIPRKIHHITVTNLDPQLMYYFKIRSGEKNTIFDDNGKPFSVTTAPVLGSQPAADLINGVVISNNKPATDAIVYVTLPQSKLLSTQVKKDGTWLLNLALARSNDLNAYATYNRESTTYEVFIQGDDSTSKLSLSTMNDSPVPDVVLGENYDFVQQLAVASPTPMPTPQSSSSAQLASQLPIEPMDEASPSSRIPEQLLVTPVDITNPFEQYEELSTQQPEFQGVGPSGTVLTLTVSGPDTINTTTTVDSSGRWSYTPTRKLQAGKVYVLGISFVDDGGEEINLERSFKIAATAGTGGTTPAYTATTSASPIATARATVAPRRSMPSTASGTPVSGFDLPTLTLVLLGLGLVITGWSWKKRLAN